MRARTQANRAFACLFVLLHLPVLGQQAPSPTANSVVSDAVLYRVFFRHIQALDDFAAQITTAGKDPKRVVNTLQLQAGLTDGQAANAKTIARKCHAGLAALDAKAKPLIDKGISETTATPGAEPSVVPQLKVLEGVRKELVAGCIDQLKVALGPSGFHLLDTWIRKRHLRNISTGDLPLKPH